MSQPHKAETYARLAEHVHSVVQDVLAKYASTDLQTNKSVHFCVSLKGISRISAAVGNGEADSQHERAANELTSRKKCMHMYDHRGPGYRLGRQNLPSTLDVGGVLAGNVFEYCYAGYSSSYICEIASALLACECDDFDAREIPALLGDNPYFQIFRTNFEDFSALGSIPTGC